MGNVIGQAGVTDTAGATLPFQDGFELTVQIGAHEWPAIYLSFQTPALLAAVSPVVSTSIELLSILI